MLFRCYGGEATTLVDALEADLDNRSSGPEEQDATLHGCADPMPKVIAHVIPAEWQHRHGIAAQFTDASGWPPSSSRIPVRRDRTAVALLDLSLSERLRFTPVARTAGATPNSKTLDTMSAMVNPSTRPS